MGTDDVSAAADQPEPGLAGVCSSFGDLGSAPRILAHALAFLLGDLFLTAGRFASGAQTETHRTNAEIFSRPLVFNFAFFLFDHYMLWKGD